MATRQPLYNEGSAVRTQPGQAQLASIPGRGVTIDSGALMAAVQAPQLDVQGAADVGRGYARLGQNIAALGEPFVQLAEEQARMYNANRVSDARNMLSAARDEIAVAQEQEPDEMKWAEITQRIGAQAVEKIYGMNLSPAARDEIDSIVKGWNVQMEGGTRLASARKSRADYENDLEAQYRLAGNTGDVSEMDRITDHRLSAGLISKSQADLERASSREIAMQAQRRMESERIDAEGNNVASMAAAMNINEVNAYIDSIDVPERARVSLRNYAQGINRDKTMEFAETVLDGLFNQGVTIENGVTKLSGIWNEKMLDAVMDSSPFSSQKLKSQMLKVLQDRQDDVRSASLAKVREVNGGANFYEAYNRISAWTPPKDGADAAYQAASYISWIKNNVRDDLQKSAIELIQEKMSPAKAAQISKEATPYKIGNMQIAETFRKELDGYQDSIDKALKSGGVSSDAYLNAKRGRDAILEQQGRMQESLMNFLKDKPDATSREIEKHLNGTLLPGQVLTRSQAIIDRINGVKGDLGPLGEAAPSPVKQFRESPDLIDKLPEGLAPHAQDFIDAGREYGMDPKFLAAISMLETDSGRSSAFRNKNNAMGISDSKGPTAQESVRDSIFKMAKSLSSGSGYYKNANTIDEIGAIYAPPGAGNDPKGTNSGWASGVKKHLKSLQ